MRTRLVYSLVIWLCSMIVSAQTTEPLAVITASTSPLTTLSMNTLKQIYARKILLDAEGKRWIPLNLPAEDALRRSFSLELFSALPEEQENYWNDQYFNGITPPQVMTSEEAVMRFVALTPGSIGYIRKTKVDQRVKVLLLINPSASK